MAKSVVAGLTTLPADQKTLRVLCSAWQWRKGAIKAKKAEARKHCAGNERICLEIAQDHLGNGYDLVKERAYAELDQIVQSSSLVECINSVIRPCLNNSKNHVTQETLNLIMFYHNHRRYRAGKRKGSTPVEILTGRKQEKDWIELLLDIAEEKEPSFFAAVNS
ncbi:hypothetical protein QUF72_01840 [Desulfobacterales bacterium HSG2]|nr:hypothetical protein [Desulfobacterales bacterium HSG2]